MAWGRFTKNVGSDEMLQKIKANRKERLEFTQTMLRELHEVVLSERCSMLAHLIEMAYLEASDIVRDERPFAKDTQSAA